MDYYNPHHKGFILYTLYNIAKCILPTHQCPGVLHVYIMCHSVYEMNSDNLNYHFKVYMTILIFPTSRRQVVYGECGINHI